MGTIKKALPVKLISGLIYTEEEIVNNAKERLIERFGAIDSESQTLPFDFTTYYEEGYKRSIVAECSMSRI